MAPRPERVLAIDVDSAIVRGIVLTRGHRAVAGGYAQLAFRPEAGPGSVAGRIAAALDVKATLPVVITCHRSLPAGTEADVVEQVRSKGFAHVESAPRDDAARRANPNGGEPDLLVDSDIADGLLASHAGLTLGTLAPVVGAALGLLGMGAAAAADEAPVAVWHPGDAADDEGPAAEVAADGEGPAPEVAADDDAPGVVAAEAAGAVAGAGIVAAVTGSSMNDDQTVRRLSDQLDAAPPAAGDRRDATVPPGVGDQLDTMPPAVGDELDDTVPPAVGDRFDATVPPAAADQLDTVPPGAAEEVVPGEPTEPRERGLTVAPPILDDLGTEGDDTLTAGFAGRFTDVEDGDDDATIDDATADRGVTVVGAPATAPAAAPALVPAAAPAPVVLTAAAPAMPVAPAGTGRPIKPLLMLVVALIGAVVLGLLISQCVGSDGDDDQPAAAAAGDEGATSSAAGEADPAREADTDATGGETDTEGAAAGDDADAVGSGTADTTTTAGSTGDRAGSGDDGRDDAEAGTGTSVDPQPTADPVAGLPPLSSLPERGAVFRPPILYLEGPVQTQEQADQLYQRAIEVVGPDNVVNEYVVRPDAPPATNGNVRVEQAVLFESGSAVIADEFVPTLELGVAVMTLNPQVTMIVQGHTDSVGSEASNRVLSERRAQAVVDYLVGRGVPPERLRSVGFGESQPVATNDTADGRQINRRIEVVLLDLLAPQ